MPGPLILFSNKKWTGGHCRGIMNTVMEMKYSFSQEDYVQIKATRKKNQDKKIDKRLEVLELRCEGMSQQAIAEATGFHRSHINNLIRKYFEEGNGQQLISTKQDAELHGFGLKSVRKTLKKYGGDLNWEYNNADHSFTVTVMLSPRAV